MKMTQRQLRKMILEALDENHNTRPIDRNFQLTETRFRALTRSYLLMNEGRIDEGFLDFLKDMIGGLFDFLSGAAKDAFGKAEGKTTAATGKAMGDIAKATGIKDMPSYDALKPADNANDAYLWATVAGQHASETSREVAEWTIEPAELDSPSASSGEPYRRSGRYMERGRRRLSGTPGSLGIIGTSSGYS